MKMSLFWMEINMEANKQLKYNLDANCSPYPQLKTIVCVHRRVVQKTFIGCRRFTARFTLPFLSRLKRHLFSRDNFLLHLNGLVADPEILPVMTQLFRNARVSDWLLFGLKFSRENKTVHESPVLQLSEARKKFNPWGVLPNYLVL